MDNWVDSFIDGDPLPEHKPPVPNLSNNMQDEFNNNEKEDNFYLVSDRKEEED